jgi:hypothetical protein
LIFRIPGNSDRAVYAEAARPPPVDAASEGSSALLGIAAA